MSDQDLDKHYQDCPGCLCELRAENGGLKETIKTSSDLYEKLVTKQLQAERELADELAKVLWSISYTPLTLDECIKMSKKMLKEYKDRRKLDE